jgi:DNA-directed RNA polymerase specialized sigma24 family protein
MMDEEGQDALLERYLNERDPAAAQECLEELLSGYVEPIVRDITRYKSRVNGASSSVWEAQDEDDIRSEVVLQLISRLRDLRGSRAQTPIANFRGYVAATTYNTYHKYLRAKYPARWRLKNRLRYLLNHRGSFAVWENEAGEYLCGLAAWPRSLASRNSASESQLSSTEFVDSLAPGDSAGRMSLTELVNKLLVWRGRPVLLDELVGIVAELQDITDPQAVHLFKYGEEDSGVSLCELLPDPHVDIATALEQRLFLERLWREVCQLPQRQRVALLLNLRDASAGDALILFTLMGIVNLRGIAEALEIRPEELASLWNKLPLQDADIAVFLGITRQQVINLRKSARERLARRVVAY